MFFLTAVTRKLAIASFLCEYSGAFSGTFSKIRLDIYLYYYVIELKFVVHVFNLKSAAFLMLETVQNRGPRYVYL